MGINNQYLSNILFIRLLFLTYPDTAIQRSIKNPAAKNEILIDGVSEQVICRIENWKFNMESPVGFYENSVEQLDWKTIRLPCKCILISKVI